MIFHDELQIIFEHVAKAFGFRMSLLGPDFMEVTPQNNTPHRRYCQVIQENLGLLGACLKSDANHCLLAKESGETTYYSCHAGIAEAIFPLFFREKCLGYILAGQFRREDTIPDEILKNAGKFSTDLRSSYDELPLYDSQKLMSVLELVRITTSYIMENRILEQKQNTMADTLIDFLQENLEENPRIEEAALYIKRSAATVNSILKEATGLSFKQLSVAMRMEKASSLLEKQQLSVQEVARAVGMEDQFYFSRLFKKTYGLSPREFKHRKTIRR